MTAASTLLLAVSCAGDAFAQAAASCVGDVAKNCAQMQQGRGRVSQCLKQSTEQLSTRCRAHVRAVQLQLKETRATCEDELILFCEGADLTEPRIAACLNRNRASLSPQCARLSDLLQKKR